MRRFVLLAVALLGLSACSGESIVAPPDVIARFDTPGTPPPTVTLFTAKRVLNDEGGHTALLINAPSQRVVWDPAGTFESDRAPEVNDVHFGINDFMWRAYVDYHVRPEWYAVLQTVEVTPEVAERLLAEVKAYGAVGKAHCGLSTSTMLARTPGFESMSPRWYPNKIQADFAQLPGVRTEVVRDGDAGYSGFIRAIGQEGREAFDN